MRFQELGDRLAVLVVSLHPQLECLQSSLQQIDVVRRVDAAHDAAQIADRFQLLMVADNDAGQQIVVAAQVLRGRMQDVIDAVCESVARCRAWPAWRRSTSRHRWRLPILTNRSRSTTLKCGFVGDSLTSSRVLVVDGRFHRVVVAGLDLARDDAESRQVLANRTRGCDGSTRRRK